MTRKSVSLSTKLAAALLMLRDEHGERLIPHEHAKLMGDDQILSLFQWDHYPVRHEDDGPDEAWNLTPRLKAAHREKTSKIDIPQSAKKKRILRRETEHRNALASKLRAPDMPKERPRQRWPSRPFNRGKAPTKQQTLVPKVLPRRGL